MLPMIFSQIMSSCQALTTTVKGSKTLPELLLTGQSAGGGVAALICAHIRNRSDIAKGFKKIHCITVAAPPILAPLIPILMDLDDAIGLTLSILNYGDLDPRAEEKYIRSLLQLYYERAEDLQRIIWVSQNQLRSTMDRLSFCVIFLTVIQHRYTTRVWFETPLVNFSYL